MTTLKEYLDTTKCEDDLKNLIELIAKQAEPIRKAFLTNQEYTDSENIYGEKQIELDKWSDEHLFRVFEESGLVKEAASEERPDVVSFPDVKGNYGVAIDPLDGSSLVQVNLAVGTIVGIYDNGKVIQKGENLRAAMYIVYGPLTVCTVAVKEGVYTFTMTENGEYLMTQKDVKIPEGKLFASGALKKDWFPKHRKFIDYLENEGYKLRYSGSFVADMHQYIRYGGVFSYPAYKGHEGGKLRLLFEANPLGFIVTQAGGRISDGSRNILTIEPEKIDHRVPLYIGSKKIIEKLEEMFKE